MERITSRTAAEDVRKAAGYDEQDWGVFQKITLRKARQFTAGHEGIMPSWSEVEPRKQKILLTETNKELEDLELPVVNRGIFHWRMRYALARAQKELRDDKQASATATTADAENEASREVASHVDGRAGTAHQEVDSPSQGPGQSLPSIHEMLRRPNKDDGH